MTRNLIQHIYKEKFIHQKRRKEMDRLNIITLKLSLIPIIIGSYILLALVLNNLWVFYSMAIVLFALGISED